MELKWYALILTTLLIWGYATQSEIIEFTHWIWLLFIDSLNNYNFRKNFLWINLNNFIHPQEFSLKFDICISLWHKWMNIIYHSQSIMSVRKDFLLFYVLLYANPVPENSLNLRVTTLLNYIYLCRITVRAVQNTLGLNRIH